MSFFIINRRNFTGDNDRFLQFGGSAMKRGKNQEGFWYSWRAVVLILFFVSFIVAAASIYMADCLFERALGQEYIQYIQIQKQYEDSCELEFNDGIHRENVKFI